MATAAKIMAAFFGVVVVLVVYLVHASGTLQCADSISPCNITENSVLESRKNLSTRPVKYKYRLRVVSDLLASLHQPSSNDEQVELFAQLLEKMADPNDIEHHDVTHVVVAGGLLSFSLSPSRSKPEPPQALVSAVFSGQNGSYWHSRTKKALNHMGRAIKKLVSAGKSFTWLRGSGEFNITVDMVAQHWPNVNRELFMIPEFPIFDMWSLVISSGQEHDFFAKPVPSTRRPFSYYIDRLLADSLERTARPPRGLEWGIAHEVISKAFTNINPSAAVSSLQVLNPDIMRLVLAEALRLAWDSEDVPLSHTFQDGHWNIVMSSNGTFEISQLSAFAGRTVSVAEVIEQYEFLVADWLADMGEAATAKVLSTTAFNDYKGALKDLSQTPSLAVVGHTMQAPKFTPTANPMTVLFLGSWFASSSTPSSLLLDPNNSLPSAVRSLGGSPPNFDSSRTFVDIFVGTTFAGATRPLRAEVYRVTAAGEAVPFGVAWERSHRIISAPWGFVIVGVTLGITVAALTLYLRDKKVRRNPEVDLTGFGGVELQQLLSRGSQAGESEDWVAALSQEVIRGQREERVVDDINNSSTMLNVQAEEGGGEPLETPVDPRDADVVEPTPLLATGGVTSTSQLHCKLRAQTSGDGKFAPNRRQSHSVSADAHDLDRLHHLLLQHQQSDNFRRKKAAAAAPTAASSFIPDPPLMRRRASAAPVFNSEPPMQLSSMLSWDAAQQQPAPAPFTSLASARRKKREALSGGAEGVETPPTGPQLQQNENRFTRRQTQVAAFSSALPFVSRRRASMNAHVELLSKTDSFRCSPEPSGYISRGACREQKQFSADSLPKLQEFVDYQTSPLLYPQLRSSNSPPTYPQFRSSTLNDLIDEIHDLQQTQNLSRRDTNRMIRSSMEERVALSRSKRLFPKTSDFLG